MPLCISCTPPPPLPSDRLTGGSIVGDIAPYQAFAIGGLNSVRGYGEGAIASGRSCLVAKSELTFPFVGVLSDLITFF